MAKTKVVDIQKNYKKKYGFNMPDASVFKTKPGLSEETVRQISAYKKEPKWMLDFRLNAYKAFVARAMPTWGADLSGIDFDRITYYHKPTDDEKRTWDEVPADVKTTFERLGIPQAEREFLSGVKAQYDSEVAYSSLREELAEEGVIFLSTDEALKKYPHFFDEYFGKIIPAADNKFAALNSAVWSGGSFVYIPKGVTVKRPLQAYFRINAERMGQFERTLIIADEGSYAHYVEGCFTKGHKILANPSYKNIEDVKVGDRVLTHRGEYKNVYHTQERPYTGDLYNIVVSGQPLMETEVTEEHPFLAAKRTNKNERNKKFDLNWTPAKDLSEKDYLVIPITKATEDVDTKIFEVEYRGKIEKIKIPNSPDLFRLIGYFLAEGSVEDRGYLKFSFASKEREYIEDVKRIVKTLLGHEEFHEFNYKDRAGTELVFSSAKLARIFKQFGIHNYEKHLPSWIMLAPPEKQRELILGYFRGGGNYYKKINKHGLKELFRINTTSETLAFQIRDMLLRSQIVAFLNVRDRSKEGRRKMFTIGIGGEFMKSFGEIVGVKVDKNINLHKRATLFSIDENYAYLPIKKISRKKAESVPVYNFSVEGDESYVANSFAVHNCTAPVYTTNSLHSAVVEVIVKPGARFRYTTIQNWSNDVYNLVTKRAKVEKNAVMEWIDGNLGSRVTMKYPSCFLVGEGAHGEVLSIAYAGKNMHQDAGAKMMHLANNTTSQIVSKSISVFGGRTSYRGMVRVSPIAKNAVSHVECDALILDDRSASDTFPTMEINESSAKIEHEATVSKVGAEKLFYLMSRGLSESEAMSLVVSGFIEPIVKELPMEYSLEMNRLIELEMEGSVG